MPPPGTWRSTASVRLFARCSCPRYRVHLSLICLCLFYRNCRRHAAGSHLLCLSNALDPWDATQRAAMAVADPTLSAVALDLCGPLPPYHPGPLHAMVAKGKLPAACKVLRALLAWLRARKEAGDEGAADAGDAAVVVSAKRQAKQPALVIDLQVRPLLTGRRVAGRGTDVEAVWRGWLGHIYALAYLYK